MQRVTGGGDLFILRKSDAAGRNKPYAKGILRGRFCGKSNANNTSHVFPITVSRDWNCRLFFSNKANMYPVVLFLWFKINPGHWFNGFDVIGDQRSNGCDF